MMDRFITRDGKRLRRGYTTGTCAAAAAKSAAMMLLSGHSLESVHLLTPSGMELDLPLKDIVLDDEFASCGIVKDSGDDPDVTDGITVYARVEKTGCPYTVEIDGDLYQVIEFLHVKPGKGAAFVRTKIRNIRTGNVLEKTFRGGEKIKRAHIEHRHVSFTYIDGDMYHFMDMKI